MHELMNYIKKEIPGLEHKNTVFTTSDTLKNFSALEDYSTK